VGVFGVWKWKFEPKKPMTPKTVMVKRGDVVERIVTAGKMEAGRKASLNFPVGGRLVYVGVHEGDEVKRGQWLYRIDPGDMEADVTRAWYRYLAADANAHEVEDDMKNKESTINFAEKNTLSAAQTARDIAYENWLQAKRDLENHKLVAPFAGVVTHATGVAVGDTVGVTDGATIVDPTSLYFEMEADEGVVPQMYEGKSVKVRLDAFANTEFDGVIEKIDLESSLSSSGATVYKVRVELPAMPVGQFRIGMNGEAEMILKEAKNVLVVPVDAVEDGILTLLDTKTGERKVKVVTGVADEALVEVSGEVREGDVVVVGYEKP
jgi:RND family efflux transporter MFP subunit